MIMICARYTRRYTYRLLCMCGCVCVCNYARCHFIAEFIRGCRAMCARISLIKPKYYLLPVPTMIRRYDTIADVYILIASIPGIWISRVMLSGCQVFQVFQDISGIFKLFEHLELVISSYSHYSSYPIFKIISSKSLRPETVQKTSKRRLRYVERI